MNKKRIIIVAVVLIVGISALSAAPRQGKVAAAPAQTRVSAPVQARVATPVQGRVAAAPMQGRMATAPVMQNAQAGGQKQMVQARVLQDEMLAEVPAELQELIAQHMAEAEQRQALNQANRVGYGRSSSQKPNRNW